MFDRNSRRYRTVVGRVIQRSGRMVVVYALLLVALVWLFMRMPTSSCQKKIRASRWQWCNYQPGQLRNGPWYWIKVSDHFGNNEKQAVESVFTIAGFSFCR